MRGWPPEEQVGDEVARYGSFQVREVRLVLTDGRLWGCRAELFLLPDPSVSSSEQNGQVDLLPISPSQIDLAHVIRDIRMWVTYRIVLLNAERTTLHEMERALRHSRRVGTTDARDTVDAEDPYASVTQEEVAEFHVYVRQLQREFERVEQARLELEAQHPELNLEPFDVNAVR